VVLATILVNSWITGTPIDLTDSFAYSFFGPNANLLLLVIPFLIADLITNGEEIGWRGYVLPRLQVKHSALVASLILGVIWGLWHLPKFINHWNTAAFGWFMVGITANAILYTWIYNNTKGSLLLASLFHAASNTAGVFLPVSTTVEIDVSTEAVEAVILVVIAAVVVYVAGAARLSRSQPKQVQEEPGAVDQGSEATVAL
jgi:membrane protease YdiL (CAAX protease family)